MGKKKHPEHVNHERWLVSYADFITLLFAFFVVLFASGQSDKKKAQKMAGAFQQAFGQMALFEPHAREPPLNDGGQGASPEATPKPLELPLPSATLGDGIAHGQIKPQQMNQFVQDLSKREEAKGKLGKGELEVRAVPEGVALTLREGGFFGSGSADVRPQAAETLEAIAAQLGPATEIRVEGHTDNQPIHSAQFPSNWELSSARASAIAHFLLEHGQLAPSHLSVAGYAEFHPLASNASDEGRSRNRRVDIVFLAAPATR
jgi:chemotaxis protein MotB